ncbi:MAG: exodeoxyribonuclease VII small subunit [Planctomycetales bacterium]|nr:exodeoxyribonuclease VII small subunit [Planctomycetales bacterium]
MAKKQDDKKNELDKLSFEQAIEMLTGIVDKIETGQVPLAESLRQYEKGMALIKRCRAILLDAEERIDQIAEDKNEPQEDVLDEDLGADEESPEDEAPF